MRLKKFYTTPISNYSQWIDEVPHDALSLVLNHIYDYINLNFPLSKFIRMELREDVDESTDKSQVSCFLTSHGTSDSNKSARYFRDNRDTGEYSPAVFCYKCGSALHTFGYIYTYYKQLDETMNTRKVLRALYEEYSFSIPLTYLDEYEITLEDDECNAKRNTNDLFLKVLDFRDEKGYLPYIDKRLSATREFCKL